MERSNNRERANSDGRRSSRTSRFNALWGRDPQIIPGQRRQQEIFERMTSPELRQSRRQEHSPSSDATTSQSIPESSRYTTIIAEVAAELGIAVPNKDTPKWQNFCSEYSVHDPKDKESLTDRQAIVLADMMSGGKDKYITDEQRTSNEYKEEVKQILNKFEDYKQE